MKFPGGNHLYSPLIMGVFYNSTLCPVDGFRWRDTLSAVLEIDVITLMRYFKFILKSSLRNKRRTILTVFSIAFSLFLLATLQTILSEFDRVSAVDTTSSRLVVRRATSLGDPLPLSYRQKLERVPGVKHVTAMTWYGGVYIDEKNFFPNFALDPDTAFEVFSEMTASPEQILRFQRDKSGAIVGRKLAQQFGWKIGDKATLNSKLFPVDLEFTIRGIYEGADETWFIFRQDYFNEALFFDWGAGTYWLTAKTPDDIPQIIQYVDAMFKNTPAETKTETEKQFNLDFVNMLGNIKQLITSISIVVIFTIMLVCATTMSMSIREKIKEIAVLKTLGFPKRIIYLMVISEAVMITTMGGILGCFGAAVFYRLFDMATYTHNFFPRFEVLPQTVLTGIIVSITIGFISAWIPAYGAIRLSVTEGLKHIG